MIYFILIECFSKLVFVIVLIEILLLSILPKNNLKSIKERLKTELDNSYSLSILCSSAILLRNILSDKYRLITGDFDFNPIPHGLFLIVIFMGGGGGGAGADWAPPPPPGADSATPPPPPLITFDWQMLLT